VLRLAMLRTHYRQPIDWTVKALEEAERTLDRWYGLADGSEDAVEPSEGVLHDLADDLNTPGAIAALHGLFSDPAGRGAAVASARLLGLMQQSPAAWAARREADAGIDQTAVAALVEARLAARRAKQWADSDRIRDALAAMGVVIKDNKDGTTSWDVGRKGTLP
jgi:cysteinyl-tRNA synthetase